MASFVTNLLNPQNRPFTAFNFLVEIQVDGVSDNICGAGFSECDGLEMSITPNALKAFTTYANDPSRATSKSSVNVTSLA